MCMFCAAIPMAASIGTAVTAKHHEKRRNAVSNGELAPVSDLPVGKIVAVVVVALMVSSAVYHTVVMPRTGAFL